MDLNKDFTIVGCRKIDGASTWTEYTIREKNGRKIYNVTEQEIASSPHQHEAMTKWEQKHKQKVKILPEAVWVYCDHFECQKCRLVDKSLIPTGKWTCDTTPDLRGNLGCHHPQEQWDTTVWEQDEMGKWWVNEDDISKEDFKKLRGCGYCKICRSTRMKRSKKNAMCLTKQKIAADAFVDKSTTSKEDNTLSFLEQFNPSEPDYSITVKKDIEVVDICDDDESFDISCGDGKRTMSDRFKELNDCFSNGYINEKEYADQRKKLMSGF